MRPGSLAEVTVDAFPGKSFPAKVTEISPDAEFTPKPVETRSERVNLVYAAKVDLDGGWKEPLVPGQPADVRVTGRGTAAVIRAGPRQSVRRNGRRSTDRSLDRRGEMFGLIGPDGAGKTTFFRIVAGLLAPTAGTLVRDPDVTFGFVPQRFAMYEDLSVDENLALRARLYGVPPAEAPGGQGTSSHASVSTASARGWRGRSRAA